MDRRIVHRMSRNFLVVLAVFSAIGLLLPVIPGLIPAGPGIGFAYSFFIAGLTWLAVAYFSGGFVSTYVAPLDSAGRGAVLYYANPRRMANLPLEAGPEVMADLRSKMADQLAAMVVAFVKGLAFFGLCAAFYLAPLAGAVMLAAAVSFVVFLFVRSRPSVAENPEDEPRAPRA